MLLYMKRWLNRSALIFRHALIVIFLRALIVIYVPEIGICFASMLGPPPPFRTRLTERCGNRA